MTEADRVAALRELRHALRTPINHIVGYTDLLLEEARDAGDGALAEDLGKIREAAEQLHAAVGELYDPARPAGLVTADVMQHELRTPLNQVIGYSELLIEEAAERGIEGHVPDLQRISAAGRQLSQIVFERRAAGREEQPENSGPPEGAPERRARRSDRASILVVDDDTDNRVLLLRRLESEGHSATPAADGETALTLLRSDLFDLVLLDVMMPGIDGMRVLEEIKSDARLRHIPVIMLSGLDDLASVARCIELGAEDFLHKPFDPALLRARIGASLERKRLRDTEQAYLAAIRREQARAQQLLLNVLPAPVAEQLKREQGVVAEGFSEATVLFADVVGFTPWAAEVTPAELVTTLNELFSTFDRLAEQRGLEKIKTIGDAYMAVAGVPLPRADHAERAVLMALDMQQALPAFQAAGEKRFTMRIGIATGPVVAGVIGIQKFAYDLWGGTVNLASRMEASAPSGAIQVSEETYRRLAERYRFEPREVTIKGFGRIRSYVLAGE